MHFARNTIAAIFPAMLAFMATQSIAGDFATFTPLGFSESGEVFGFEEFGIEDGSGFPYSNIYFLDTERDAFLEGTPIRARIEDENATISDVRAQAVSESLDRIQEYRLLDHPGTLAAFSPVTEISANPNETTYRAHPNLADEYTLLLEDFALDPTSACAAVTPDARGFRLSLTQGDGNVQLLHEDNRIPTSRNCPTGYRLGGVMTYRSAENETLHVALITVLSHGFEGNDGRWIALPFTP